MVRSDYFKNGKVRGVEYYQMLDTYLISEGHIVPQNAVLEQGSPAPHITLAILSSLDVMLSNSKIGIYGPKG